MWLGDFTAIAQCGARYDLFIGLPNWLHRADKQYPLMSGL